MKSCEELVLADNLLGADPEGTFLTALAHMPALKKLGLARNKIVQLSFAFFKGHEHFTSLNEIDLSFNLIHSDKSLWFLSQTKNINVVDITGCPIAIQRQYFDFEHELQKNLSGVVINDSQKCDENGFLKKRKPGEKQQPMPYPNPIKLDDCADLYNKQNSTSDKFLNAADMMQGVSLNLQDIKPDEELDKEIFPTELSQEQHEDGQKDVFTPPNHQQMRFGEEDQFFITEDVRDFGPGAPQDTIKEEASYTSEVD